MDKGRDATRMLDEAAQMLLSRDIYVNDSYANGSGELRDALRILQEWSEAEDVGELDLEGAEQRYLQALLEEMEAWQGI